MRTHTVKAVVLLGVAFSFPAGATHSGCSGDITPIDIGTETFYLEDRSDVENEGVSFWLYMESNGVGGLQSGSESAIFPSPPLMLFADVCSHPDPDTLIF